MRGETTRQAPILLAVTREAFVPADHPLRRIKPLVDDCLARLSPRFAAMYAKRGRPSIPPEHLLKASLLIAFFSVRSERQFCEQLRYNLLFKWFLDLHVDDAPFNATTFSKNRARLLEADVARTDAEARLYRKGRQQEAKLRYLGHALSENRHGLVVDVELSEADGYGEPGTAPPHQRLAAMRRLADAGVNAGVLMAPLLPGLSADRAQVERTVRAAADHGARFVGSGLLNLSVELRDYYFDFLSSQYPSLLDGYRRLYGEKYAPKRYRERVSARVLEVQRLAGIPQRADRPRAVTPAVRQLGLPLR